MAPFGRRRSRSDSPVRRGVQASAQRLERPDRGKATAKREQQWQEDAWAYFDDVGEIKHATWFQGNVMAKIRLFVAVRDPADPEAQPVPVSDPNSGVPAAIAARATAELERLRGPLGGRSEICRELNMNLEIAGEAYLVGYGPRTVAEKDGVPAHEEPEEWAVYSVSEVEAAGKTYRIKSSAADTAGRELNLENDTIIRIWQRHPRYSMQADCNMRGVLSELEALVLLRNAVKAEAKSRMTAGIFTLPNELGFGPDDPTEGEDGEEATNDALMQELYEGATDPVEDPSSAAAVAPTFLRGPAEFLHPDFVRHITLGRESAPDHEAKITARVEAIARGVNMPVETMLGHQQTTFANATQVKEDEYDDYFQPRCTGIVDAFTVAFLQPNLLDQGLAPEVVATLCIWWDPSGMIKPPEPAESADYGLEHDAISWEAWRRHKNFSDDDAPDAVEVLVRAALKNRTFDPGVSTALLELLGVPLDIPAELPGTQAAAASIEQLLRHALAAQRAGEPVELGSLLTEMLQLPPVRAAAALPSPRQAAANPGRRLMLIDRELRARLQAAASASLTRALERAGNRLRSKAGPTRELVRRVNPQYVAQTLGPALVADAGFADDELIGGEAWDSLEQQFLTWGEAAQHQALEVANEIAGLSAAERDVLQTRQAANLGEAWDWMRDALHGLAQQRLYAPDPLAPALGEFDPTSKVPTGLIRQALARAGGASGLTVQGTDPYVVLNNGQPPGGIGPGELIRSTLTGGDVAVEAYEWVYGPAYRAHPFEDHEALDGEVFTDFDSDVLSGSPFDANYYPGDHDGCNCDVAPVLVAPEDLEG